MSVEAKPSAVPCSACEGRGWVKKELKNGDTITDICVTCKGTGAEKK